MTIFHIPGAAAAVHDWLLLHPNLANEIGPWALILGAFGSLGATHAWPRLQMWLDPLEFFLERDVTTSLPGLQSFPSGIVFIQVYVKSRIALTNCRAWIHPVEYKPDDGVFSPEHRERLPCQWSWAGTTDPLVCELGGPAPAAFNVAKYMGNELGLDPATPTNLLERLKQYGLHKFTVHVIGESYGKSRSKTKNLIVDWRGNDRPPIVTLED